MKTTSSNNWEWDFAFVQWCMHWCIYLKQGRFILTCILFFNMSFYGKVTAYSEFTLLSNKALIHKSLYRCINWNINMHYLKWFQNFYQPYRYCCIICIMNWYIWYLQTIDMELRKLEVAQANKHIAMLQSFMPEFFVNRGGNYNYCFVFAFVKKNEWIFNEGS